MPINNTVLKSWVTTAFLTLAMSIVVALAVHYFWDPAISLWGSAVILSLAVGMGIAIMAVGSLLLKRPELQWVLGRGG
jgi:hypothetical protein